jgi:hypothetical protein
MPKIEIDVERLVAWAYQEELSKRQLSSAEGIWDRIQEDGQRGGIDPGHGAAQRYCHFGLPDPDAERIEKAIGALDDLVIDWNLSFDAIAPDLAGLVTVNDLTKQHEMPRAPKVNWGKAGDRAVRAFFGPGADQRPASDRPRDILMVNSLSTSALVTMHAIKGNRPDWVEEFPKPLPTPAARGTNAMIIGECKGKNLYSMGSVCPLKWSPSPLSILTSRADYVAWHRGLATLAEKLQLEKFTALPPKAAATPWLDDSEEIEESREIHAVMPNGSNSVRPWGTLPLKPARGRMGAPIRTQRASPVRYPLEGAQA